MDLTKLSPLTPVDFFQLTATVKKQLRAPTLKEMQRSFLLPSTAELLAEEVFAEVAVSWNEEGLYCAFFFSCPFQGCVYPDYAQGDAIQLFIDTRDLKDVGSITRFCHHFLVLPKRTEGVLALELTRFRAEESHPLCDPEEIGITFEETKKGYAVLIEIPKCALCGYDPALKNKIGFTYKAHRLGGKPQHFAVSSCDYAIEQYPKLWSSLYLT